MPRQKQFEPEQALQRALEVFWEKSYEATSMQDLVDRMGINRFSLYDTFGGKHDLFLAVLDRYRDTVASRFLAPLEHTDGGLAAVRQCLRAILEEGPDGKLYRGCLMVNSTAELAGRDHEAMRRTKAHFLRMERAFRAALGRARDRGEIAAGRDLDALARSLTTSAAGLAVLAMASPSPSSAADHLEGVLAQLAGAVPA
jgi:TetR/AcrR family transcriptional repressor of nem operon